MNPSRILFVIQPATINAMLNNNGPLLNNRLRNVARKHDLTYFFSGKCKLCNKGFVESHELARHMRVHTDVSPYECKFCDRTFKDNSNLAQHEKTHGNARIRVRKGQRYLC